MIRMRQPPIQSSSKKYNLPCYVETVITFIDGEFYPVIKQLTPTTLAAALKEGIIKKKEQFQLVGQNSQTFCDDINIDINVVVDTFNKTIPATISLIGSKNCYDPAQIHLHKTQFRLNFKGPLPSEPTIKTQPLPIQAPPVKKSPVKFSTLLNIEKKREAVLNRLSTNGTSLLFVDWSNLSPTYVDGLISHLDKSLNGSLKPTKSPRYTFFNGTLNHHPMFNNPNVIVSSCDRKRFLSHGKNLSLKNYDLVLLVSEESILEPQHSKAYKELQDCCSLLHMPYLIVAHGPSKEPTEKNILRITTDNEQDFIQDEQSLVLAERILELMGRRTRPIIQFPEL